MWQPESILTFDTKTEEWSKTKFDTFSQYRSYILSMWKTPGEYNFRNTEYWIQPGIKFQKDKRYCDYHPKSKEYKQFWLEERRKCIQGIIVDDRWISPDMYFFWNYCPIFDKLQNDVRLPRIWDSHYHYDLHCQLAFLFGEDVAMTKSRQKGMEQPDSELVLTKEGWRPMGTIKVGDFVYTPKGTLTKVLEVFPQGVKDVYELELLDGRKVKCGENHLWAVKYKRGEKKVKEKIRVLSTKDLVAKGLTYTTTASFNGGKKEYIGYSYALPEIEPVQFEKKDLKIPPYVLGCLLADGSTNKTSVQLCSSDQQIFDEVLQELGEDYEYGKKDQQENNASWRYSIIYKYRFDHDKNKEFKNFKYGVNPLSRYLEEYNLRDSTCYNKHIPEDYLFSNFEDRLSLLQGLMDCDGYINKDGADIHFTTVSKQLALDVAYLSRSLGINSTISEFKSESNSNYYRVRIKSRFPLFRLERKLERQRNRIHNYYRIDTSIKSITKLNYQESSTCIMVEDEDHLYLTRDFIPTHNSLYHVARMTRKLWFNKKNTLKIVGHEEIYVQDEWSIMEGYRNHLNEHTGWYRHFSPSESLNWEQKREVTEGVTSKKKIFKGNKSKIKGLTTKMNVTKAVGGAASEIYVTEAGVNPKLKKIKEFVDPNMKMGNVKTGLFCAAGAVGELKDCEDLMEYCFNPKKHNIRAVKDIFSGTMDDIAFFFPEEWNYTYQDEETGEVIICYDKDGNSDIELARSLIQKEDLRQRQKDEQSYKLWKSQHPRTLQDAFDQREDNPFPTEMLKEQEFLVLNKKEITVELVRDINGKITHKFSDRTPIAKLKPNPNEDNRGVIVVREFPIDKPPFGLYYAGVDPIYNLDTSTSSSLMSVRIWIGTHEKDGKISEPYPVAWYIGRHPNVRNTYQICIDLIEWYNARTAVESNVKDFTEWCIREGKSKYLMRRRELTVINEMFPNSTIQDEIGVRMTGDFKNRALERYIAWLQTPIATSFNMETGEGKDIYNVSKISDPLLIKEMLRWTPKLNTDRLVSDMLALIACQSDTNRHIITSLKNPLEVPKNPYEKKLTSVFKHKPVIKHSKIKGHFG